MRLSGKMTAPLPKPCFTLCVTYWGTEDAFSWLFYAYQLEKGLTIVQTNEKETKTYTVPQGTQIKDLLARAVTRLEGLEISFFLPSLMVLPVSGVPSYNVILRPEGDSRNRTDNFFISQKNI